jgi:DNA (cytosine-5)-methyltransferase 1
MTTLHTLKQITKPSAADVKAARALTGLSQSKASERIGAALRTWQSWEGGERTMPAAKWKLFLMLI